MTQEQFNKLDKCYFNYSLNDRCVEEVADARILLGTHRFDLYAILFYIDQKVKGVSDLNYAREIYKERTRAMTGFKLSEIGNSNKTSFENFIKVLDQLISDFQNGKYDFEKTLIPIDKKGEPIDGAHRISCAAYFNKKVKVLRFLDQEITPYDYRYLKHELMPSCVGDIMALEALKWHNDIYALFLWPKAIKKQDKLQEALKLIRCQTDVLYQVEYKLSFEAIINLMIQLYGHMDWVGTIDDGFANITGKADEVWDGNGKVQIVLTRANNCSKILSIKSQIRELFGIGLSSIHSTDNMRETIMAMNALLNPNSRHHLFNADVKRYKESYKLMTSFKEILITNNFDLDEFIIDSSIVLSIYGLRAARDLDYYCLHNKQDRQYPCGTDIEEHDSSQKKFYSLPVRDLILNPNNYFVYNELKFVTLNNLLQFKQNRYRLYHDIKDIEDIKLIQNTLREDNKLRKNFTRVCLMLKRKKRIYKHSIFVNLINVSKKLHVYEPLRVLKKRIYRICNLYHFKQ